MDSCKKTFFSHQKYEKHACCDTVIVLFLFLFPIQIKYTRQERKKGKQNKETFFKKIAITIFRG